MSSSLYDAAAAVFLQILEFVSDQSHDLLDFGFSYGSILCFVYLHDTDLWVTFLAVPLYPMYTCFPCTHLSTYVAYTNQVPCVNSHLLQSHMVISYCCPCWFYVLFHFANYLSMFTIILVDWLCIWVLRQDSLWQRM